MSGLRALALLAIGGLLSLAITAGAGAGARARAGSLPLDIAVHGTEELPFSMEELGDAVNARLAATLGRVDIQVSAGRLVLRAGGRQRLLLIEDRRGSEAARIVAQAIGDLLLEATPPPLPPRFFLDERRVLDASGPRAFFAVWPSIGVAYNDGSVSLLSLACDLDLPLVGPFRVATQLAGSTNPLWKSLTLRPAIGVMEGPYELRVGPVGALTRSTMDSNTLIGGFQASLVVRVPISGHLLAVLELGGDVYLNRAEVVTSTEVEVGFGVMPIVVSNSYRKSAEAQLRSGAGLAWAW